MSERERIQQLEAEVADLKAELRALLDKHADDWAAIEHDREEMIEAHHVARLRELGFIAEQCFGGRLAYPVEDAVAWIARDRRVSRVYHQGRVCYVVQPEDAPPTAEENEGDIDPGRFPFA